jgi:hypothetical protein
VEVPALSIRGERREAAAVIAARRFGLDDVGAEVGERQAAERTGDQRR